MNSLTQNSFMCWWTLIRSIDILHISNSQFGFFFEGRIIEGDLFDVNIFFEGRDFGIIWGIECILAVEDEVLDWFCHGCYLWFNMQTREISSIVTISTSCVPEPMFQTTKSSPLTGHPSTSSNISSNTKRWTSWSN